MRILNSEIYLVQGIKLDRNYVNVLSYSENQMLELCKQNQVAHASNFSFIRPQNSIYVNFSYEDCLKSNYIAFQNPDYSNKWFFAFIDEVIYKGERNTEITYKIDSWSTWFDDWQKQPCFISRQHVNDDTIGLHTIPENLDVGDVIEEKNTEDLSYNYFWVAISCSWDIETQKQFSGINVVNKSVWGKRIYLINPNEDGSGLVNLGLFLYKCLEDKHIEDVSDIFIVPDAVVNQAQITQVSFSVGGQSGVYYKLPLVNMNVESFNTTIAKRTSFSDYTPKNNKCFVYPYNYLLVTNNSGNYNIFKYENFFSDSCVFRNDVVLSIGGSARVVPLNYKKMVEDDDEAIPLAKYPVCGWSADSFTNWLTQNSVNLASNVISTGVTAIKSGNPIDAGISISSEIASQIGSFYTASLAPNLEHGNQNVGDVVFSSNRNVISFKEMRVKTEYLKIIDDYFSRFGYKINNIETPNIIGRQNWNYVEIGQNECIGYGTVPTIFMDEINNACRKGVTIWHNHANIGNYSLSNNIV